MGVGLGGLGAGFGAWAGTLVGLALGVAAQLRGWASGELERRVVGRCGLGRRSSGVVDALFGFTLTFLG